MLSIAPVFFFFETDWAQRLVVMKHNITEISKEVSTSTSSLHDHHAIGNVLTVIVPLASRTD
jgi:hypothetical protein